MTNLRIQLEVPAGRFEFLSSNLPAIDSKEWHIFALNQYEGGTIEIKGKAFGEVGENIVFKARVGIIKDGQYIVMKEIEKLARLIKPSIYIRQEINGHPEYVASPGDWLHYEIYFKNVGEEDLKSLILIANLEGDYFDFSTLQAPSGHFQPGEHSIIFDWKDNMDLQLLPPMKEGKVEFWIRLKSDILEIKEPTIKSKIFIGETKEEFVNKIAPKLIFSQSGYFEDEVFGNSGPLPPKVGQPTTYTIIWRLNSGASSFKDVKVTAFLPFNVSLTGKIFPETEISKFSFDSNTREIMWAAGEVQGEKTIAFQIKLVPNESDKGKMPTLIEKSQVLAQDPWTEKEIKIEAEPINTFLKTDFTITQDKAIVN
ncbi:hypothetical protein H5T58_00935 [Candidatus Parcubacteria bacterium]|nr:hypothetical protein [Candidatus Parcubacteria bacterium]